MLDLPTGVCIPAEKDKPSQSSNMEPDLNCTLKTSKLVPYVLSVIAV